MRLLRAEIADARKRQAAGPRRVLVAMAVVILPLWVLTILTSKLFVLPTLVWLSLAALIGFWSARDVRESFVARVVPIAFLPWSWIAAFFGAVVAIAWLTAMVALNRVLRAVGA